MTQTTNKKKEFLAIAEELKQISARATELRTRQTTLLNSIAQEQAEYQQGTEVDIPYGYRSGKTRRYRITAISGSASARFPDVVDTRYHGRQVRADGSLSDKTVLVWPNEFKNVYPPALVDTPTTNEAQQ